MHVLRRPHSVQPTAGSSGMCKSRGRKQLPRSPSRLGCRADGASPTFPYKARPRGEEPGSGRPGSCHEAGEGRALPEHGAGPLSSAGCRNGGRPGGEGTGLRVGKTLGSNAVLRQGEAFRLSFPREGTEWANFHHRFQCINLTLEWGLAAGKS